LQSDHQIQKFYLHTKEIMVPRTEMNIISKEMPAEEALQKMSREKYTRIQKFYLHIYIQID
jgi:Mg2+/Co2+ transporter CorB